jgi:hypothetical protein
MALAARDARASLSIAITWESLLRESTAAAVVTPLDALSVWEDGRIYTYTRVRVERMLAGELATGSEAWVRTMGGVIGRIGQLVEGEAVLAPGQASLLFLHGGPPHQSTTYEVTARAQGQFPLVADSKAGQRLVRSAAVDAVVLYRVAASGVAAPLAAEAVQGRAVDDVVRAVAAAWSDAHAR